MKAKRLSKAQRLDIITTLPQTIIETILCLLPIEEAARTGILSREWRYKWTTIPKLVFSLSTIPERKTKKKKTSDMESARKNMDTRCKLFYAIYQVLLLRQNPIHEFTLSMQHTSYTGFEIDQIILNLSMNHPVKKLSLEMSSFNVPSSLFSLHQLTDLSLNGCIIKHKPIFNGFGSLTSLALTGGRISRESFLHLFSRCPSLKIVNLLDTWLYLGSSKIPTIMELFECLPAIEHLSLSSWIIQDVVKVSVSQEPSSALIHLKYVCIRHMHFYNSYGLTFLAALIKCSPNLEKIKLQLSRDNDDDESVTLEEYSDVWIKHLNELEIDIFANFKPAIKLVKFMLARSPNLKKVILNTWMEDKNEELEMLKILLRVPKASPVEVIVENRFLRFRAD